MSIDEKELDGLIERVKIAKSDNLSLTSDDLDLVLRMLTSLSELSDQLTENDITLHKLKKLAGLIKSSEKLISSKKPSKPKEDKVVEHQVCNHKLESFSKGDVCPKCGKGKLYKYEPAITVRISGSSPLISTKHIRERLRCNACGEYFTADLPKEVTDDGGKDNQYTYSARAIMAIYRYFGGMPLHRQENLGQILGLPVSASTILNQVEYVADASNVIFNYLKKLSSNAESYHIDDTTNRILNAGTEIIPNRKTGKPKQRSGVYTSGLIAQTKNHKIVLFQTNIGHAGEFIDEILINRPANAPPPIIMSDALSSNRPSVIKSYQLTLCNAHARRNFFELEHHYPEKVNWLIKKYGQIWHNEKDFANPQIRLDYHKEHSLPVMLEIKSWCENMQTEQNSAMGKAIKYFINNFEGLSAFCHVANAKIDNNEMESTLKIIIRGRKNSLFFKTQAGADIADVLTSIIATCQKNDINSFDYLINLQKYSLQVNKNPDQYLPWNYQHSIKHLET